MLKHLNFHSNHGISLHLKNFQEKHWKHYIHNISAEVNNLLSETTWILSLTKCNIHAGELKQIFMSFHLMQKVFTVKSKWIPEYRFVNWIK